MNPFEAVAFRELWRTMLTAHRGVGRKHSHARGVAALVLHCAGWFDHEIGQHFGCSASRVYQLRQRAARATRSALRERRRPGELDELDRMQSGMWKRRQLDAALERAKAGR